MDDTDTKTIELTKDEAGEVINALSSYQAQVSGRDEERALNVREFLKREFGFKESHFQDDRGLHDAFADIFSGDGKHEIQLSRAEAAEVISALSDRGENSADTKTAAGLQDRFEETFDTGDYA